MPFNDVVDGTNDVFGNASTNVVGFGVCGPRSMKRVLWFQIQFHNYILIINFLNFVFLRIIHL